jgi:hypothetical protein
MKRLRIKKLHVIVAGLAVGAVAAVTVAHTPVQTVTTSSCAPTLNCSVNQSNIQSTICKSGYTGTIRPPVSYTDNLKVQQIARYGYLNTNPSSYQEDHMISLEVGGNPTNHENLWPEEVTQAHVDDKAENQIRAQICSGTITLTQGQQQELQLKISHGYKAELSK